MSTIQAPTAQEKRKFYDDGRVKEFKGNTFVCHLPQQGDKSEPFNVILDAYRVSRSFSFGNKITMLPPSCYHMTIFHGANNIDRRPGIWPAGISTDVTIEECHNLLSKRLKETNLSIDLPIRMKVDLESKKFTHKDAWKLKLIPVDEAEKSKVQNLRDRLSDCLGTKGLDHDSFEFHVTLGYINIPLSDEENNEFYEVSEKLHQHVASRCPVIEFDAPEFCIFEDMFAMRRRLYLS
ncbi:hypothetical protein AWJ20_5246 [Sugiyamaella lignohabitans]|uniref:DUF1868 domain-containing protein n=1 Tax=Sugiyamaella lignohabitans TaxID=796027 RepID=A0A167ENG6_9ASCO|nr:uncharacterized protein AWJ20_5246 [Sugiyamaella lignohabitans]ANB14281.1 hypothetical protein AWJ20_5246 [Sugiyamaella lignohabitans]